MDSEGKTDSEFKQFITTEQYMYRRMADLCLQYLKVDQRLGKSRDRSTNRVIARELANIFESIRSFVKEEKKFPDYIKNPPLKDWSFRETQDPNLFVLTPRHAKDYIMAVYRTIKMQQAKQKRDLTAISDKFKIPGKEQIIQ